jgi:hypothetical protein
VEPDGEDSELVLGSRDYTLAQTNMVGVYELEYLDEDGSVVGSAFLPVSLLSETESAIAPATTLRLRGSTGALEGGSAESEILGSREVRINREFYTWLILAVLLIISIEWYLYHTRAL